jgi:hypothetical protein
VPPTRYGLCPFAVRFGVSPETHARFGSHVL